MASIAPPCHTRRSTTSDEWITPRFIIERLGPFDLDPCQSLTQPWPCARRHFTVEDDGLLREWKPEWFTYCNPPYGRATEAWLNRMALHNHGIALVFARTETRMFFRYVWPYASALLFLRGRLMFHYPNGDGSPAGHNSGGPSVLVGYGNLARERLRAASDLGAIVEVKR